MRRQGGPVAPDRIDMTIDRAHEDLALGDRETALVVGVHLEVPELATARRVEGVDALLAVLWHVHDTAGDDRRPRGSWTREGRPPAFRARLGVERHEDRQVGGLRIPGAVGQRRRTERLVLPPQQLPGRSLEHEPPAVRRVNSGADVGASIRYDRRSESLCAGVEGPADLPRTGIDGLEPF